jgi:hypothetical protein
MQTRKWTELQCIGFIPSPREGHAAAIVGNVIYVFGGRGVDGKDLGDLAAFKISSAKTRLILVTTIDGCRHRSKMVHVSEHGSVT